MDSHEACEAASRLAGVPVVAIDRLDPKKESGLILNVARYVLAPSEEDWRRLRDDPNAIMGWGSSWEKALMMFRMRRVTRALHTFRFIAHDERKLYAGLEQVIRDAGIKFERERPVKDENGKITGRLDFFLPDDEIAIEVKVRGQKGSVRRQIERYAREPWVKGLLLITTVFGFLDIPEEIEGKRAMAFRIHGGFA